jgi:hypothetical protein
MSIAAILYVPLHGIPVRLGGAAIVTALTCAA